LVVLFIGANVLILYLWRVRRGLPALRIRLPRLRRAVVRAEAVESPRHRPLAALASDAGRAALARVPRGTRAVGALAIAAGLLAFWLALPPLTVRALAAPLCVGALA